MNFVFISPNFPKTYYQFCKELKNLGVNILGIGSDHYWALTSDLRDSLTEYYQVPNMENYGDMFRAVAYFSYKYGHIDYIESNNEYWLEMDAKLRTDFNVVTGKKNDEILFFKSKEAMKTCYKKAKVKVARYIIPTTLDLGQKFIKEVGYPVVVKPDNGVGAQRTYLIKNDEELEHFYLRDFPSTKYIMEEYIEGDLISFDGIVNSQNEPVFFSNEVFPTPIMEIANELKDCFYYSNITVPKDLEKVGRRVLKGFDARSRYFHLEFFRLTKAKEGLGEVGDLIGLEVNMRAPGGYTPDVINFAHSVSTYKIWAETMVFDKTNEDLNKEQFYCGCYGRRFNRNYVHTKEEIYNRFPGKIVMYEVMPPIIAGAMGDETYYIKTKSFEELIAFRDFLSERQK